MNFEIGSTFVGSYSKNTWWLTLIFSPPCTRIQTSVRAKVVLQLIGACKTPSADGTSERGCRWRCFGMRSSHVAVVCCVRCEWLPTMLALHAHTHTHTQTSISVWTTAENCRLVNYIMHRKVSNHIPVLFHGRTRSPISIVASRVV